MGVFSKIDEPTDWCAGMVVVPKAEGRSQEEHYARLVDVLERLRKEGVTFNKDICQFYVNCIKFLGQVLNEKGIYHQTQTKYKQSGT